MTKLKKLIERKSAPAQRSACRLDLLSNRTLCLCAIIFSAAILYTATSAPLVSADTIVLNGTKTTSGTVSSPYQITLSNFNVGTGSNRVLIVGIEANNAQASTVKFGGVSLTPAVSHFINNDAEFWYLKNPNGTANIVVTMYGSTSVVVGAYSFFGVDQTNPIPTTVGKNNTAPSSPSISITTANSNSWVLDSPAIYGGITLSSPTCTQRWDINIASAITGASSSKTTTSPGSVTCSWTASTGDYWDDVAIEVKAAGATVPGAPTNLLTTAVSSSQINLSWTAPSNNGGSSITGYKIDRSPGTPNGCPIPPQWTTIVANTGNTATTYSNTGLSQGQYYCYQVSAINSVGTGSPSNDNQAFTFTVPYPPVNLTAAAVSSSQINLSWVFCPPPHAPGSHCTGGTSVTGYKIERSLDGGNTWSTIVPNNGNNSTTTYSDTGLAASTTYTYRVSAINSVGSSSPSNTASATTLSSSSWHSSTGIVIPLYTDPGSNGLGNGYQTVINIKNQYPHVPMIVVVNVNSGPLYNPGDTGPQADWTTGINNLRSAGIIVLGYVWTGYGSPHNSATCCLYSVPKQNVTQWHSFYPAVNGIMFDGMAYENTTAVTYYQNLTSYAKSLGMTYTMGNPGSPTLTNYVASGAADAIDIFEVGRVLSITNDPIPATFVNNGFDKHNFSFLSYSQSSLPNPNPTTVGNQSNYVGFMYYASNAATWDTVPTYLSTLAADLNHTSEAITINSVNSGGSPITHYFVQITQNGNQIPSGFTPLPYNGTTGVKYHFIPSSSGFCLFDHWQDNNSPTADRVILVNSTSATFTAVYRNNGGTCTQSSNLDQFGVLMIYPTINGGNTWFFKQNDTNPTRTGSDPRFDPQGSITKNADGSWKRTGSNVRMDAYAISYSDWYTKDHSGTVNYGRNHLRDQTYMDTTADFGNYEMTGYVKLNAWSGTGDSFTWYGRGGLHHDNGPDSPVGCEGSAYKLDIFYTGGQTARFAKESWHVHYDFQTSDKGTSPNILNKWIGIKMVVVNKPGVNFPNKAIMQGWIDANADGNWTKIVLFQDDGFGSGATHCPAASADNMPISWKGPSVTFRWDLGTDVDFKWLSVREIDPAAVS